MQFACPLPLQLSHAASNFKAFIRAKELNYKLGKIT